MFRRWRPTADDASPWEQGSWWRSAESAPAPTCWPTRWVATRSRPRRRRASSSASQQPAAAEDLGFPAFATKNTTRVAGADPAADAAGVALAVFPSTGGVKRPAAVTLVADDDWPAGLAAASLVAAAHPRPDPDHRQRRDPRASPRTRLAALAPAGLSQDGRQADLHDRLGDRSAGASRAKRSAGPTRPRSQPRSTGLRQKLTGDPPAAHPAGQLRAAGVRDARRRLGGALGRPRALRQEGVGARADARRASPPPGRPGVRARPAIGDLRQGARGGAEAGPRREADRRRGPG